MNVLVTGGSGFIGSAVVRHLLTAGGHDVTNVDKLTYAANPAALDGFRESSRYRFVHADICDAAAMRETMTATCPDVVIHLAAESHVDRSIDAPAAFIQTNLVGTSVLLDAVLLYWRELDAPDAASFRFVHVSTDEVFGSLGPTGVFTERTAYDPSSPYSASKAGSDHLARAWHRTYGLPVIITNCSNNYGPWQHEEKLVPLIVRSALAGMPLPIYGNGSNVRDWLHVDDHADALVAIADRGVPGATYLIGTGSGPSNVELVRQICAILDELRPDPEGPHARLITFVADRPGHDFRYAVDSSRVTTELGWQPRHTLEAGLRRTVQWHVERAT